MDYVGINANKKDARETDSLVHGIALEADLESPERGDESASCVRRCFPHELRLAIFTVCWVVMFAAFPFWIYTLRIPLSHYELFSNVFTFTFFFFSFFAWVIFLVNHFSPVAATLELLMPARPIQSELLLARRVSVSVASIFCRERLFHVTRNFVGIAHSWHALSLVLEAALNHRQDQRTTFNHVHYVLDNSGAAGLPQFLRALAAYLARDPKLCQRLAPVLHHAPVQPTRQEYQQLLPKDLRKLIGTFLATHPDSYDAFAPLPDMPFDEVYLKYGQSAKANERAPKERRDGEVTVSLDEVARVSENAKNSNESGKNKRCATHAACGYAREDIAFRIGRLTVTVAVLTALGAQERAKAASLIHCANVYREECPNDVRFLAISDARHMMTPKFWIKTMPHFFRGRREITSLRWVQGVLTSETSD